MPRVRLNAKNIATLPALGQQTDYFDSACNVPGFGLRVSASGRTWFLMFRDSHGRQRRFKLGTYEPMKLADAREAARAQLLSVQVEESNPAEAKRQRRNAETFQQLADAYIEQYARPQKRSWPDDARQLRSMVLPKWRTRAAADITRTDVRLLLEDVARTRSGLVANHLRALLSKVFRWSVATGRLPANPASDLPKLARENSRERQLSDAEIKTFWTRLDAADPTIALWLRLRLLTGQRGETVTAMRWAHVDWGRRVWEIPGADMKRGNAHVVPLSRPVLRLLQERRKTAPDSVYVLDGRRGRRQRLGATAIAGLPDFQLRDLRRTAASGMARLGHSRFIVQRVLGHIDRSVGGVYDRYSYLAEKRRALDAWAAHVAKIIASDPHGRQRSNSGSAH